MYAWEIWRDSRYTEKRPRSLERMGGDIPGHR